MKYLLIILLFFISLYSFGQTEIYRPDGSTKSAATVIVENTIIERQVADLNIVSGNNNIVSFKQIGVNEARVSIRGDYNQLFIVQEGVQNAIKVSQQGDRNQVYTRMLGDGTTVSNLQIGNQNYIDQDFIDSGNSNFVIIQNGDRLRLNQTVEGVLQNGMEVKMYGKEMEISINTKQ